MQIKIPSFIRKYFSSQETKTQKDQVVARMREWKANVFTKELLHYLEHELEREVLEEESKSYVSLFMFRYSTAQSRGKRAAYRNLIKQLRSDDV